MAKTPFKLKSGNGTPFKQMGSAPMTRNQARTLSQKHMEGGAYTTMPGESRFQMSQRLRRAGKIGDTDETYIGKHLEANKMKREGEGYEGKTARKGRRKEFQKDIKSFLGMETEESEVSTDASTSTSESTSTSTSTGTDANVGSAYVKQEFKGDPGDKYRYRKIGEKVKKGDVYNIFEFMKPGSNTWTTAGPVDGDYDPKNAINKLFTKRRDADELFDSPD